MRPEETETITGILRHLGCESVPTRFNEHCADLTASQGGVYFLIDGSDIVYIGQTSCMAQRFLSHYFEKMRPNLYPETTKQKTWDLVWFASVPPAKRNDAERILIERFRPEFNGKHFSPNYRLQ